MIGDARHVSHGRKAYRCDWCDERIEAGEPSVCWVSKDGSDLYQTRVHPECNRALADVARDNGGRFEWESAEFSRGCGCLRGECECKPKEAP